MQQGGYRAGGLASAFAQVEQPEPERDDAADSIGGVPSLVAPLLVGRVRGGPVEFYAHSEPLVEVVEVPVARVLPDPCLSTGCGQPVRAFHPVYVAVLQHRQRAIGGVAKRERDLPAPAHLLASGHGESDPIGGGAP